MTGSGHGATDANTHAWEAVLDRLERDVEVTEELVRAADGRPYVAQPAQWDPPELHGPLPDHLLQRAREVHHRLTEARAMLSCAVAANRASADRLATRPLSPTGSAPAYVDVSA